MLVLASNPKNREFYEEVFNNLNELSVTSSIAVDYIDSLHKNRVLRELAMVAYESSEGKKPFDEVTKKIESLNAVKPLSPDEVEHKKDIVNLDLEQLVQHTVKSPGLRWRLRCLNESLGSLRKGDFGFIFARPESYSRDTEVLTPTGWITVDKVTTKTEIAQVDSNLKTSFVQPKAVHSHEQEFCYHIHDTLGRVDLIVTEGHGMVVDIQGSLYKERADTVKYYQGVKHHVAAKTSLENSISLTDVERLAIAYQADGHSRNYKNYGYTFSFKKERKIERLVSILSRLGWEYSTYKDGNREHTGFYIKSPQPLMKDFSWVDLKQKSVTWCQQFIEELSYWDSTRRTGTRFKFDTTNKEVANKVQAIAILAGYNCLLSVFQDSRKSSFKDIYSLSIRTNYVPVDGQCIQKERIPFTDTTYCFEVPTGMLLVRRNGAVAVCGNTGKTTFLASEVSYMLTQTDKPILWCNNEEQGEKVGLRVYQAFFGAPLEQILANVPFFNQEFKAATGDRLIIVDTAQLSKSQMEVYLQEYQPGLLVIDQIDKIKGFDADREDLRLGEIYKWAREQAKEYCPVIGVSQADGSGEGVRYLTMQNVANAKTSKQAEADWILGIGCVQDQGYENVRFFNISKNKLMGDEDTKPALRHGKFEALIMPIIARYQDIK